MKLMLIGGADRRYVRNAQERPGTYLERFLVKIKSGIRFQYPDPTTMRRVVAILLHKKESGEMICSFNLQNIFRHQSNCKSESPW